MDLVPVVLLCFAMLSCIQASQVKKCEGGKALEESSQVVLSNCDKPPCRLRRKTTVTIELKFKPDADVKTVHNSVHAKILGLPFPFIGVDGTNVCSKIFDATSGAKASCPIQAGGEYVYKDEFKILEIYPKIKVLVHWALKGEDNQDILCFEVPARITS